MVIFNVCIHTFQLAPIRSGVMAQTVAIVTNYLGNRYWTYRHIDKSQAHRETMLFFFFSGVALVLESGILALSHYGLGYTSALADNIAKNVVGLGIGTAFRFWSYRTWVFRDRGGSERPARGLRGSKASAVKAGGGARRRASATGDSESWDGETTDAPQTAGAGAGHRA